MVGNVPTSSHSRPRNRKRSKRRSIFCPVHGCYLDSVSQKHTLFASESSQLQARGLSLKRSRLAMTAQSTVPLNGEWLEAFWCAECQATCWYHVCKREGTYSLSKVPDILWKQASGVVEPWLNPSVSEYSYRHSRLRGGVAKPYGAFR